jgi:hypothetical protein
MGSGFPKRRMTTAHASRRLLTLHLKTCSLFRSSHGMRNEMHIWLKWLHRLTQCSRFFLARDQKYLCPLETGGSESMLSSQFTDELNLVAHPVGIANS